MPTSQQTWLLPSWISGLSFSSYYTLIQECPVIHFSSLGWRQHYVQWDSSLQAEHCWSSGCRALSLVLLSSSFFCSHLSTFKYLHVWISQAYLCIEQGILYWVIAVQIVETLMERPRVSLTLPLFSFHQIFCFLFFNDGREWNRTFFLLNHIWLQKTYS